VHRLLIMVPWSNPSPQPKRHFDQFSHFCMAHDRDRPTDEQTDRQTDHATQSVTIRRICVVLQCGLKTDSSVVFARWLQCVGRMCAYGLVLCYALPSNVVFERPFVKRFALCCRTVVCLSCPVCDVGVFWSNSWMDQDETWHGGRPRPRPHCIRCGPSSPQKGA